jgi:hypothetical protein
MKSTILVALSSLLFLSGLAQSEVSSRTWVITKTGSGLSLKDDTEL